MDHSNNTKLTYLTLLIGAVGLTVSKDSRLTVPECKEIMDACVNDVPIPDVLCKKAFSDWILQQEAELKERSDSSDSWLKLAQFVALLINEGVLDSNAPERAIAETKRIAAKKAATARYRGQRERKVWFQTAYREVRALLPDASRDTHLVKVFEDEDIPPGAKAWARDADRQDGFVRRGGRPRRPE